jgi:hypothetical protein
MWVMWEGRCGGNNKRSVSILSLGECKGLLGWMVFGGGDIVGSEVGGGGGGFCFEENGIVGVEWKDLSFGGVVCELGLGERGMG